ncbi:MAG: BatD family protein, partial [Prevotella sp.]|nr:BatD family protein [Prevotella sp.]
IKVSANKRRVHEQEPVLLTYKVYTLVDLTQLNGKMPDLTGFHTQEIPLPQQKSFHVEQVNGRPYRCVTWSQYVMYPQMTGKLEIPSITFKGIVVQQNRSVDPFEAFFNGGSGYVEVKHDIVAPSLTIQVDPLPDKPADFSGGVGQLNISAQIDKQEVKAGDPISLRVIVGGNGNLKLIKQPVVDFPKDFDKYDAKVTDKTKLTTNGVEGNMVYDFLAVPRNQGTYTIPPISLVYFDTQANAYRTAKTQPFEIVVGKGSGKSSTVADYTQEKERDIRPIKTGKSHSRSAQSEFFGSRAYWISLLLPLIAFIVLLIVFRKRAIDNADLGKMRGKKANKVATRRLRKSSQLMKNGQQDQFYDEVLRALWGYVGDKLNMPVEELSRENISEKFHAHDVDEDTIGLFLGALDECEFERYAPGDSAGNMNKTFEAAMKAIEQIETTMKKSRKTKSAAPKMLLLMALFAVPLMACAGTKESADEAYKRGNYQQAIKDYESLLQSEPSAELYYNLGNAYFRTDQVTQAILAYERALKIKPGDNDIRFNLEFARSKTIDKITPESEMFFFSWYRSLVNLLSIDAWARLAIVSIVVVLVLLLVYLFASRLILRQVSFYGAALGLLLFVASNFFAFQQQRQHQQRAGAVVTAPSVSVKKTPGNAGTEAFLLHEGTRVTITDKSIAQWIAIRLDDGREGWIPAASAEEI